MIESGKPCCVVRIHVDASEVGRPRYRPTWFACVLGCDVGQVCVDSSMRCPLINARLCDTYGHQTKARLPC